MAELSYLDPSSPHTFPESDPYELAFSDPNLFAGADFPIASDVDLDDLDLDLDFSVDDLLLSPSDDNGGGSGDPRSNSASDLTANSNSNPGSPVSGESSAASGVAAVKREDTFSSLKRKKGDEIGSAQNPTPTPTPKLRRSEEANSSCAFSAGSEEDEKRKARLMRNRESAQLSRQRKKHYIEELEDKVKRLSSTIADLNGKVSFYASENARLNRQLTGNGGNPPPAAYPPPPPYPFPWVPYSGYPMRPGGPPPGPYVPIPRLKPRQPAPVAAAKAKRSSEGRKRGSTTKKVASVSLLGLLFIVMVFFGGFASFGQDGDGGSGRVLNVRGRDRFSNRTEEMNRNSSESLPALLYVPRNGKHVEINGNLIIHSVLASERAMAQAQLREQGNESSKKEDGGSGLAIAGGSGSALAVPNPKAYRLSAELPRALASDARDTYRDNVKKSAVSDGPLQQWFREGLAGPILSSGTCTEAFQFEVSSPSSAIVPMTTVNNATEDLPSGRMKNRRVMYPLPIPLNGSVANNTKHFGKPTESGDGAFCGNKNSTSMVVSVLADPREAGDDGMITPKALSRIFVVVLIDSVKYVTYSCVLPLKTHGPHLVN